jgi:Raf kinase inhibitor-like YbhB/YbcL family protein
VKESIMTMTLTSTAFAHLGMIPKRHTCDGEDVPPPLTWSGVPPGAKSLVLFIDDPDAPDPSAPQRTWVHWVIYDIPPATTGLPGGTAALPPGARPGVNDWKRAAYGGPCPPIGRHRYFFKLYALDTLLSLPPRQTKAQVLKAMAGHVLAETELMGTYEKRKR